MKTEKNQTNWLQQLKDESWEAELLISTVAIFGTLQLFDLISWGVDILIDNLHPSQYKVGYLIVHMGILAVSILVTMFIIHFLLRAYWVGLVGLNSVFPDYGLEDSVYSEIYTKKILKTLPKLEDTVKSTDELCSVIFSAASIMVMLYSYIVILVLFYLFCYNALSIFFNSKILLVPIFIIAIAFLFFIPLAIIANLKKYKENEKVQESYFNLSKWGSILFLGPLYKNALQISMTFSSNYKKKKSLIGLLIIFILVGFIITHFSSSKTKIPYLVNQEYYFDKTKIYSNYYASKMLNQDFLIAPQIDSDIIESKITLLFIPIYQYELKLIKENCEEFVIDEEWSRIDIKNKRKKWYLECYEEINQVYLNGNKISSDFIKFIQPETKQYGIITYIDLEGLEKGKNVLKVLKNIKSNELEWEIPFQYIPKS